LPEGSDTVVRIEDVEAADKEVKISESIEEGAFVVKKGDEFRENDPILESGALLDVGGISSLIAGGHVEVKVNQRPRVYVLAAGDELRGPGRGLSPGQGYPGLAYGITAVIEDIGVAEIRVELVPDEKEAIMEAVPDPGAVDMIITIGGTGGSDRDLVVTDLKEAGVAFLFHGVRMRPCHSVAFGIFDKHIPVVCLPGGISAAELGFYQFALPLLMRLSGHTDFRLPEIKASIEREVSSHRGQLHFMRTVLERDESKKELIARPLARKKIYQEMTQSHGYIVIPEDKEVVEAGEEVTVQVTKREWSGPVF
jgi:molybdopterin molybdotransferase